MMSEATKSDVFLKFAAPLLLWVVTALSTLIASSSFAQKEVATQKEADWVDSRWNATDLGNFHASLVSTPGGTVAKGLSIRLGEDGKLAVAYDTATASPRALWSDGFLEFEAARYGLLRTPHPAGDVQFVAPKTPAWDAPVRWRGLHVNGPRVVLDYEIGATRVLETPWAETASDVTAVTRSFLFRKGVVTALLAEGTNAAIQTLEGVKCATINTKFGPSALAFRGDNTAFEVDGNSLKLRVDASKGDVSLKLFGASSDLAQLVALTKASSADDVAALAKPGPSRWKPLTTRGQRGFGADAFVIDTLTMPYDNPWKALMFASGVDFLPNGDAAVCTIHGDVWLVSGIDENLQKLTWRRFATGLFQPLGLRVRDGKIHVLGRDQITVLHDENGDGEADFYENFFNGIKTSTGGHDYATSLDMDANGNFYYVDPTGVYRVLRDGSRAELIAAGFRNPNGAGVSPDGKIVTVAPQQGEWTPSSVLIEAKQDGWYGYGGPRITETRPLGYDAPLCWIPHSVDNSSGSQLWITGEKWKPLAGHMLHFSWGRCTEFLVLREVVDGVPQGALVPLPGRFLSGVMRGAFNPKDGQLYVVGSTGWQTAAARDGCFQRVRFTGKDPRIPIAFNVHTNGIRLTFTTELDRAAAEDAGSYGFSQWNYLYSKNYGSKDYLPSDPAKEGRETLEVKSVKLLPDHKTIFIELPDLKPVMQFEVKYSLNSADGKAMRSSVWGTINRLGPKFEK